VVRYGSEILRIVVIVIATGVNAATWVVLLCRGMWWAVVFVRTTRLARRRRKGILIWMMLNGSSTSSMRVFWFLNVTTTFFTEDTSSLIYCRWLLVRLDVSQTRLWCWIYDICWRLLMLKLLLLLLLSVLNHDLSWVIRHRWFI